MGGSEALLRGFVCFLVSILWRGEGGEVLDSRRRKAVGKGKCGAWAGSKLRKARREREGEEVRR